MCHRREKGKREPSSLTISFFPYHGLAPELPFTHLCHLQFSGRNVTRFFPLSKFQTYSSAILIYDLKFPWLIITSELLNLTVETHPKNIYFHIRKILTNEKFIDTESFCFIGLQSSRRPQRGKCEQKGE